MVMVLFPTIRRYGEAMQNKASFPRKLISHWRSAGCQWKS